MLNKKLIAGLCLVFVTLSVSAAEIMVPLQGGKPSQQEFEGAAKRALFSRNYAIWSVDPGVVIGKYKNRVEVALILADERVILRTVDDGGVKSEIITKYMRNLERDFTYELADYALAPVATTDPAKVQALLDSALGGETVEPSEDYVITGRYQSRVTRPATSYAFRKSAHRSLIITFTQDGDELIGVNESADLKISATIEGDEIRFSTWPSDITGSEIKGKWKIQENGRILSGKWTLGGGGGDWNLNKID